MATKGKSENKTTVGRPKKQFDLKTVALLGRFRATYETMADELDCHVDTIRDRMVNDESFLKAYKKGFSSALLKLSEAQFTKALGGTVMQEKLGKDGTIIKQNVYYQPDTPMLIWLGKQYLGQSDTPQTVEDDHNVSFTGFDEKSN